MSHQHIKVRIALVTVSFLPQPGGAEFVIHHLGNQWAAQGHEVRVFNAVSDRPTHPEAKYSVSRFSVWRGATRFGYHRFPWFQASTRSLGSKLRRFAPDFISAHSAYPAGLYLAAIPRNPAWIVTCHGTDIARSVPDSIRDRWNIDSHLSKSLGGANAVISICPFARRSLEELGISGDRCIDLPNGVDYEAFQKPSSFDLRKYFGIPSEALIVLTVARNFPQKNLALGIRAFRRIVQQFENAVYVVVGRGVDRLQSVVHKLGLQDKVRLHSQVLGEELIGAHQQAEVYLSTSAWEFCPLVILEAMAAGTPQVATDVPGNQDLVRHDHTGFLVAPDSEASMADAVFRLLSNCALRGKFRGQLRGTSKGLWLGEDLPPVFGICRQAGSPRTVLLRSLTGQLPWKNIEGGFDKSFFGAKEPGIVRLKLAMVAPFPLEPSKVEGGVSAVTCNLVRALSALNEIDLHIVAPTVGLAQSRSSIWCGIPVDYFPLRAGAIPAAWRLIRGLGERFIRLIESLDCDVVHLQGAASWGIGARQPQVLTLHALHERDARFKKYGRLRAWAIHPIERRNRRSSRNLIIINPWIYDALGEKLNARCWNIENPVDDLFFGVERKPRLGQVLYAGHITPRKNLAGLIRAFSVAARADAPAHLRIAGGGVNDRFAQECHGLVGQLKLSGRVTFLGPVAREELAREMSEAHCLALFSFQETAPMVIAEALAAGLPVAASNVGGISHMLDDGANGLLASPYDEEGMAATLLRILRPETNQEFSAHARIWAVQRFRAEAVAIKTVEVYRQVARVCAGGQVPPGTFHVAAKATSRATFFH